MEIKLTKEELKVNKWVCHSVTVYKLEDGTFEATLFNIKGITKKVPVICKYTGKHLKTLFDEKLYKTTKYKKVIKSKTFEYSGIELKQSSVYHKDGKCFFATNQKSNYINYYVPLEDIE